MYQQYIAPLRCIFVTLMRDHSKGILYYVKQLDFFKELSLINRYLFLLESQYITATLLQELQAYIKDRETIVPKPCVNC